MPSSQSECASDNVVTAHECCMNKLREKDEPYVQILGAILDEVYTQCVLKKMVNNVNNYCQQCQKAPFVNRLSLINDQQTNRFFSSVFSGDLPKDIGEKLFQSVFAAPDTALEYDEAKFQWPIRWLLTTDLGVIPIVYLLDSVLSECVLYRHTYGTLTQDIQKPIERAFDSFEIPIAFGKIGLTKSMLSDTFEKIIPSHVQYIGQLYTHIHQNSGIRLDSRAAQPAPPPEPDNLWELKDFS